MGRAIGARLCIFLEPSLYHECNGAFFQAPRHGSSIGEDTHKQLLLTHTRRFFMFSALTNVTRELRHTMSTITNITRTKGSMNNLIRVIVSNTHVGVCIEILFNRQLRAFKHNSSARRTSVLGATLTRMTSNRLNQATHNRRKISGRTSTLVSVLKRLTMVLIQLINSLITLRASITRTDKKCRIRGTVSRTGTHARSKGSNGLFTNGLLGHYNNSKNLSLSIFRKRITRNLMTIGGHGLTRRLTRLINTNLLITRGQRLVLSRQIVSGNRAKHVMNSNRKLVPLSLQPRSNLTSGTRNSIITSHHTWIWQFIMSDDSSRPC